MFYLFLIFIFSLSLSAIAKDNTSPFHLKRLESFKLQVGSGAGGRHFRNSSGFCVLSEGRRAPLLVKFDARCGEKVEGTQGYYWDFGKGDTDHREITFRRFESEGTYSVSLYRVDENGSDVLVGSQKIVVEGEKPNVTASFTAIDQEGRKGESGYYFYTDGLPNTIEFSATKSWSQRGKIIHYEWSLGEQNRSGEITYFTLTEGGSHTVVLTVTDDEGNTDSVSMIIQAERDCIEGSEEMCLYFEGSKNRVLPVSQTFWTLKTTLSENLKSKEEHDREFPNGWVYLRNPNANLSINLSPAVSILGRDLVFSKESLKAMEVDFTQNYELSLKVIDVKGDKNSGFLSHLRFGIGKAVLTLAEDNLTLEIVNKQSHFYKRVTTSTERRYPLSDLAVGSSYNIIATRAQGESTTVSFTFDKALVVTVPVSFPVSVVSTDRVLPVPEAFMSHEEMRERVRGAIPGFDKYYQDLGFSSGSKNQGVEDSRYPWWTRRCDGKYPTHLPFFRDKIIDEFDMEGVRGWYPAVASYHADDGSYLFDRGGFREVPPAAIDLNGNKRELMFVCEIRSGGIHRELERWKFSQNIARTCCGSYRNKKDEYANCLDSYGKRRLGVRPYTHENTLVTFDFRLKEARQLLEEDNESDGGGEFSFTLRESFLGAACRMGLCNYESLINYFGIYGNGNGVGRWAPSFTVKVPVPDDIEHPALQIDHWGFGEAINYGYSCYLAQKEVLAPEITYVGAERKKMSDSPEVGYVGSIGDNTRRLQLNRFFPLDVMSSVSPSIGGWSHWVEDRVDGEKILVDVGEKHYARFRNNYKFAARVEVAFKDKGWGRPNRLDLTFSTGGRKEKVFFILPELAPCTVPEDRDKDGETCLIAELDMEDSFHGAKVSDRFNWERDNASQGQLIVEAEAIWREPEVSQWTEIRSSQNIGEPFTPLFNLYEKPTYNAICKGGHYRRPIGFGTAKFFNELAFLAEDPRDGDGNFSGESVNLRCNDISLPFGGKFDLTGAPYNHPDSENEKRLSGFSHKTHRRGDNLDTRYFDSTSGVYPDTTSRKTWRLGVIANFAKFVSELRAKYDPSTSHGRKAHIDLRQKCTPNKNKSRQGSEDDFYEGPLGVSCGSLDCGDSNCVEYSLDSIVNFCQIAVSRGVIDGVTGSWGCLYGSVDGVTSYWWD